MTNWQSHRSSTPPWPGISFPKSFRPYARLRAEARNPPKGATREAKIAKTRECN